MVNSKLVDMSCLALKMRANTFYLLGILLVLSVVTSCIEKDYDGPLPLQEIKPVVNALLMADSTLQVHISMARPMGSKMQFENVNNANVKFYKDSVALELATLVVDGNYITDYKIKEGATYSVEVAVLGFETITASTKVPLRGNLAVSLKQVGKAWQGHSYFTLQIEKPTEPIGGFWIVINDLTPQNVAQVQLIHSNSALADIINRSIDNSGPPGYSFEFLDFIRIHGEAVGFNNNKLTFAPYRGVSAAYVSVIAASSEYDNYFRALYLQKSSDGSIPFMFRPIMVPSNIVNGHGIFAGCTISRFDFPDTEAYRDDN